MRKLLLPFLIATTAATVTTPALAQRADREERAEEREERRAKRAEARDQRSEAREARSAPREARSAPSGPSKAREARRAPAERVERQADRRQEVQQRNATARDRRAGRRAANVNERGRPTLEDRREAIQGDATARRQLRDDRREERAQSRQGFIERATQARRVTPPAGARPDRPAPPPAQTAHVASPQWHTTWRHDRRYDWRRWRDRNRSTFNLGFYFDPFGWNYRRFDIGWRLWPSYYSDQYWLNDPWSYRLPYAPWPYRWVRYYDDAVLVNTMNGQVADVIYDFFW